MAYEFVTSSDNHVVSSQREYVSAVKFRKTNPKEIDDFRAENQRVEKLDLSDRDFSKRGFQSSLCSLFRSCYNLKEVNLSNCNLGALSDDDFRNLLKQLQARVTEEFC